MNLPLLFITTVATGLSILSWKLDRSLSGKFVAGFSLTSIWITFFVTVGVIPSPHAAKVADQAIWQIGTMTFLLAIWAWCQDAENTGKNRCHTN